MTLAPTIRSFVRREGRMTLGQQRAWEQHWQQYGLTIDGQRNPIILDQVFGRQALRVMDIGFGSGDSIIALAQTAPHVDVLGVEVYRPGVGQALRRAWEQQLTNIRVFAEDVVAVLGQSIPDHSLTGVQILFPDPWPKKKHHKRRLLQPQFISLLNRKLVAGGFCFIMTDWFDYAMHIDDVFRGSQMFVKVDCDAIAGHFNLSFSQKITTTKYERRAKSLETSITPLSYLKASR